MKINYTNDAFEALTSLIHFIEKKNTKGAGLRWLTKFEIFLIQALSNSSVINLCNNTTLKQLQLKCIHYNDWIIAFSESGRTITIEVMLHQSRLKD